MGVLGCGGTQGWQSPRPSDHQDYSSSLCILVEKKWTRLKLRPGRNCWRNNRKKIKARTGVIRRPVGRQRAKSRGALMYSDSQWWHRMGRKGTWRVPEAHPKSTHPYLRSHKAGRGFHSQHLLQLLCHSKYCGWITWIRTSWHFWVCGHKRMPVREINFILK